MQNETEKERYMQCKRNVIDTLIIIERVMQMKKTEKVGVLTPRERERERERVQIF